IDQLAAAADCAQSSVVNFARELGHTGYRAFRAELMEEAVRAAAREGEHAFPADIEPTDPLASSVARIAAADARAVRDPVRLLDPDRLGWGPRVASTSRLLALAG